MTCSGETVYDAFNNPESDSVFNGNKPRPAGFGYDYDRTVDISNQPYSHILALDVTPIHISFATDDPGVPTDISEYTIDNAAYVHVFVPVMFSISASSGDQYARMKVDWTTLEKIENPEKNLEYSLWNAKQIEKGNYTDSSYTALQNAISEITTKLENVWPNQTITMSGSGFAAQPNLEQKEYSDIEKSEMAEKLNAAVSSLDFKGEKDTLISVIEQAKKINENLYTVESYAVMKDALAIAEKAQSNEDAGVTEVSNAVQSLNSAIEALVYKDADYSAVDAAIEKIPADLTVYTQASVDVVNEAKNSVVRGKNITEQDSVDAMAKRITEAIAALEVKNIDSSLNKNNLDDGVYSINGEMIKVNRQDKSMSNDAVNHTIKLTVEGGKYYLTLDFHGLHYLNRFGYLANLSYYDNGYTYGQYGAINGNLIPAEVLSTQKNADGTDVVDEFNQVGGSSEGLLYPDQLKFPLVTDALNDDEGYVPLHVFVPVMEDISEGTGDQDVLLKLDWSTLKKTTEDDSAFIPDEPEELSPAVDYTDAATGVKVHADKGVFEEGVQIVVTEITLGADYDNTVSVLSDIGKKFKLYNVEFVDADGKEVTPNGTVTISLPVAAGYDANNLVVYRINDDGSKTLVNGNAADDYYTIVTKTAGNYAIVENGSTITDAENASNGNSSKISPNTGAPDMEMWTMLAAAGFGLFGAIIVTKNAKVQKRK
ncbi:MAG: NEAT domain-containing protein, partial [Eubacterium sp.]|nr:NEAT domain-containing protein [Eubacterium sp.]